MPVQRAPKRISIPLTLADHNLGESGVRERLRTGCVRLCAEHSRGLCPCPVDVSRIRMEQRGEPLTEALETSFAEDPLADARR